MSRDLKHSPETITEHTQSRYHQPHLIKTLVNHLSRYARYYKEYEACKVNVADTSRIAQNKERLAIQASILNPYVAQFLYNLTIQATDEDADLDILNLLQDPKPILKEILHRTNNLPLWSYIENQPQFVERWLKYYKKELSDKHITRLEAEIKFLQIECADQIQKVKDCFLLIKDLNENKENSPSTTLNQKNQQLEICLDKIQACIRYLENNFIRMYSIINKLNKFSNLINAESPQFADRLEKLKENYKSVEEKLEIHYHLAKDIKLALKNEIKLNRIDIHCLAHAAPQPAAFVDQKEQSVRPRPQLHLRLAKQPNLIFHEQKTAGQRSVADQGVRPAKAYRKAPHG